MAMLEKAKASEDKKDEKKKKHKHPAAKPEASAQPEDSEGADQGGDEGQQDDADSDQGEAEGQSGGAGAVGESPQGPQDQGGDANQGGADAGGDQGGGQQGQGPAPVPSPAAPGAGDTTSGGDDTPDAGQDQDPNAKAPETPPDDASSGPGSNADLKQLPMPPGLKDKYDEANQLLMQLLYKAGDDKLAQGLVQGLMPQGPGKIKNAIVLSVHVVVQIHKRMQLPPQIILPFAKDVVAHVLDLGQQVKQIQYSDQECTAILGSVYESCLRVFGVNRGNVKHVANHFGKATLQGHQQKYLAAKAHAKPAIDAANSQPHHPHLATGQQGAPTQAGPQTGANPGTQATPQQGAPPTPPVPPATPAQGMLSQGAAQPAQGAQ
jgi:hypothetical protein